MYSSKVCVLGLEAGIDFLHIDLGADLGEGLRASGVANLLLSCCQYIFW